MQQLIDNAARQILHECLSQGMKAEIHSDFFFLGTDSSFDIHHTVVPNPGYGDLEGLRTGFYSVYAIRTGEHTRCKGALLGSFRISGCLEISLDETLCLKFGGFSIIISPKKKHSPSEGLLEALRHTLPNGQAETIVEFMGFYPKEEK